MHVYMHGNMHGNTHVNTYVNPHVCCKGMVNNMKLMLSPGSALFPGPPEMLAGCPLGNVTPQLIEMKLMKNSVEDRLTEWEAPELVAEPSIVATDKPGVVQSMSGTERACC